MATRTRAEVAEVIACLASGAAPVEPGQETQHVGTLEPLWNLLDLTPEGRGTDWDELLSY